MKKNCFKYISALLIVSAVYLSGSDLQIRPLAVSAEKGSINEIKILAVRAEFETDTLNYTTGNGKFNSEYPDTMQIDAVPHDKEYFEDQLTFVKNYFESQSKGKTSVPSVTVLDTVLTLPHPIWYYNPNNGDDVLISMLKEFYRDTWSQISGDTSINFSDFNTFVIFHAGSGQEFNPGYDETPFDIPSVYLSEKDLSDSLVTAHDGALISNSVILPECEWQTYDGGWYYAGMNGISCLMFAHRLGIPNLYSSETGKSCIGRFGLMDQGSANFSGLLPAGASAWVKELTGWSDVEEIEPDGERKNSVPDSTIYKINLNADEYLLVENVTAKTPSLNENNSLIGYDRNGRQIRFYYNENGFQKVESDLNFKTLVSVEDNDFSFGLPARGILVWHIDKRRTTAYNIENNLVNDDYAHRGVYIEEADGSFDIGKDYWLLDNGYGTELGWEYDAFYSDNEVWLEESNRDLDNVEFSSVSYPRSDTNEGIQTGIKLHGFSFIGRDMYFKCSYEEQENYRLLDPGLGRSVYLPAYQNEGLPPFATGSIRHFFAGQNGNYKIFDKDSLLFTGNYGDSVSINILPLQIGEGIITVSKDSLRIMITEIISGTSQIVPAPGRIISQPVGRIIPTESGIYSLNESSAFDLISGRFKNAEKLSVLSDPDSQPIFITGFDEDSVFSVDTGFSPVLINVKPLSEDSLYHSIILTDESNTQKEQALFAFSKNQKAVNLGWCDIDSDRKIEIISASGNEIYLKNENGVFENGFPVSTDLGYISKAYIFEEYIAVIDSSSNYTVISSGGDYYNANVRTMNGWGNNSGLLKIDDSVYLYNHSGKGVLTYHKIGTGGLWDYNNLLNGVVELKDNPENWTPPTTVLSGSVYNWPNPVRGGTTNFRFFNNFPCIVEIDIYDINGNKVESISSEINSSGDYAEIEWDISDVPSGVYNAILKFSSGSKNKTGKVKVAVIK
ncbi:MAG TPA: T9SS type A sorting domain-containing protein [Clostridiales bacterium]|nr:T9SS type A sorting domain-containing protein [Clostridiales bacterium]HQP68891.1 T9SS type A sorting domain-containing protein [Clostridiales bacterium]